ncbi:MAG: hypothetical protein SGPRY_008684 [Prymnesium sp.]
MMASPLHSHRSLAPLTSLVPQPTDERFEMSVALRGEVIASAKARTKKAAASVAASRALERLTGEGVH